ncbi:hypothetical protein [Kibdelosporangium phytohabitans]|uniref:Uncharacterized protein n=1 Tax=Kibdelosporangium phytohabitans TaxID=860235 RepID=A0A0N9ICC5_9PSEU|nr:hypothetical protein [Kibdelosporangium phytohabitans]ALG12363.1 hypothetical protein AOZ06_40805 [Kibdelosporangium phytohabitans]MBE1463934.1 hypothetical protein [Kibdelosporangium phytohabitans]
MDKIDLPYRGWGNGVVPVNRPSSEVSAVLEIQGNWMSGYSVHGLIDTPDRLEQGDMLCSQNFSSRRVRAVVPPEYTHVKISKGTRSNGIARWVIGFRPADTCQELRGTVRGSHPDVVYYQGPRTSVTFEVSSEGYAHLYRFAVDGTGRDDLHYVSLGPFRGRIELSAGPILLQVDCLVPWSLTIRD